MRIIGSVGPTVDHPIFLEISNVTDDSIIISHSVNCKLEAIYNPTVGMDPKITTEGAFSRGIFKVKAAGLLLKFFPACVCVCTRVCDK